MKQEIALFWFRRDLRLEDNEGLSQALKGGLPVLPLFIFDTNITTQLPANDPRITFIYDTLKLLSSSLSTFGSSLYCLKGDPIEVWQELINRFEIKHVYANEDYEPYAIERDTAIEQLLSQQNIPFKRFKDQVIFAKDEVLKNDNTAYTVFTPYKKKWLSKLEDCPALIPEAANQSHYAKMQFDFPDIVTLGFKRSTIKVQDYTLETLDRYETARNFPALNQTSYLSPHLRFGTVSIRKMVEKAASYPTFLSELIWREFFMQILYHFPEVVTQNFKKKYDHIVWRNKTDEFEKWKNGETGYPIVDAGMRQLNETGYMHNRVRMIAAGFLCKHLLIDWRWGEAYFAEKLLDYELSSNNGNWQWSAGTGCDAAPYFRIFNPEQQVKNFDPDFLYIKKWIAEFNSSRYPMPMVNHKFARQRALSTYKEGLQLTAALPLFKG